MAKIKAESLIAYAKNAVGGGYCWGADGQVCSPKIRRELAGRTSSQSNKNNLLITCAKWDGKRVWDCSGLFRGAWRELDKYRSGGATTIYKSWCNEKGAIDTMPDIPGIAVFRGTAGNMAHIGLYIGNGEVIDARSSGKGVVRGKKAAGRARERAGKNPRRGGVRSLPDWRVMRSGTNSSPRACTRR